MTDTQDEFAQPSSGYSQEKFYTSSTDGSGGGRVLHVQVPNSVVGELGALVARQVIPDYRTTHDIMRDGLVHRLHWLQDTVKDPAALLRIQTLHDHLVVVNILQEVERRASTLAEIQRLAYTVNPSAFHGKDKTQTDASMQAAIALLADRPDLQAILQSKMNGA